MSTHVTAINPLYGVPESKPPAAPGSKWRGIGKVLAVLGTVAVVAGVGFIAGSASASGGSDDESSGSSGGSTSTASATAEELVTAAFMGGNVALNISNDELVSLLLEYQANPLTWDDEWLTADIMEAFLTMYTEELGSARRELMRRSLTIPLDGESWNVIEGADYSSGVTVGNDRANVFISNGKCFIVAEETNSAADWGNNLDIGSEDIMSINTYTITSESQCGCARRTLWWCSRANTCNTYKSLGRGYDGFTKAYNSMRLSLWNKMTSGSCLSQSQVVFAGYSRGAAIVTDFAYVAYKENLVPLSKMKLVTFGSPRVLEKDESDELHLKFQQRRLVYQKDPVPSIPYGWMGYRHVGTMECNACGYTEGRDNPNFSLFVDGGIGDHTSYDEWF